MKNEVVIEGDIAKIYCNHKGDLVEVLIDAEDLPKLKPYGKWCVNQAQGKRTKSYIQAEIPDSGRKKIRIHRVIMSPIPEGLVIDHIDDNTFDNRKSNLRVVTRKVNVRASSRPYDMKPKPKPRPISTTSGHIGISWHKRDMRWRARIGVDGVKIELGSFKSLDEAIQARIEGEKKYW